MNGRSLYWDPSPIEYAHKVLALIRWCLSLPGAQLGLSPYEVARMVSALYAGSEAMPMATARVLERFGITNQQVVPWKADEVWKPHREELVTWLTAASEDGEYIWIDAESVEWWLDATEFSLLSYAELFDVDLDPDIAFELLTRHRCTVFAPFDGGATWDHLTRLVSTIPDERRRNRMLERLDDERLSRASCAAIKGTYWSWRLIEFADADQSIIYTPLLAFWNSRPESTEWAPPALEAVATTPLLPSGDIATVLYNVYWVQLETLFNMAREANGLGQATSAFADIDTNPPVFFYVEPADPPRQAEDYATTLREAILPLMQACLFSNDPRSEQVSWGLIDGHLAVLRREVSTKDYFHPRYLVLPTAASAKRRSLEDDFGRIADQLTYVEFSIGHDADEIYHDMEPLAVRGAKWGGTLDDVAEVTGSAADLLAASGRNSVGAINERLASLHILLRRMETFVEKSASDTNQVEREYLSAVADTDDYLRRRTTISTIQQTAPLSLREALLIAYPYRYVGQPLKWLQSTMSLVLSSVDRSSANLNAIIEQTERQARESLTSIGRWLSALITLLALLIGLLQVVGQNSSPIQKAIKDFLARFMPIAWLDSALHALFDAVVALLLITSVAFGIRWVAQLRPKKRHHFIEAVQRFRALNDQARECLAQARAAEQRAAIEGANEKTRGRAAGESRASQAMAAKRWSELDALDVEAVKILDRLWKSLRTTRNLIDRGPQATPRGWLSRWWLRSRGRNPADTEWELRAHNLEHTIELFDLAPARILLPRALCVLRYKTTDFLSRTTIANTDFIGSLRYVGFLTPEIAALEMWLSAVPNRPTILNLDVHAFVRVLQARGVSANPHARKPVEWKGVSHHIRLNAAIRVLAWCAGPTESTPCTAP
jgi:hypothetical protein